MQTLAHSPVISCESYELPPLQPYTADSIEAFARAAIAGHASDDILVRTEDVGGQIEGHLILSSIKCAMIIRANDLLDAAEEQQISLAARELVDNHAHPTPSQRKNNRDLDALHAIRTSSLFGEQDYRNDPTYPFSLLVDNVKPAHCQSGPEALADLMTDYQREALDPDILSKHGKLAAKTLEKLFKLQTEGKLPEQFSEVLTVYPEHRAVTFHTPGDYEKYYLLLAHSNICINRLALRALSQFSMNYPRI